MSYYVIYWVFLWFLIFFSFSADRNSETESHTGNSGSEDNGLVRKEAGKNTSSLNSSHTNGIGRSSTPGLNGSSAMLDRPVSPLSKDLKGARSSGIKKNANKKARYR